MEILAFFATIATAAAILPADTRGPDCDPVAQIAVVSDRTGDVLYYNNDTCPAVVDGPDIELETETE